MKKSIKIISTILVLFFGITSITHADNIPDPVSINLKIYAGDTVLFNGPETVTACPESLVDGAPVTINGKCALEQALPPLSPVWIWYDSNFSKDSNLPKTVGFLDGLGGSISDPVKNFYWGWFSNLNYGTTSLNSHILSSGDELLLTYNSFPLRISASKNSGTVGDTITFTAEEKSTFNGDYSDMLWTPSLGAIVTLGTQTCTTIADGTCSIVLNTSGTLTAFGSKTLYVPSSSINIEVSTPITHSSGSSGGYIKIPIPITKPFFDLKKAFDFLKSQQKEKGSFGENLYTDWVALALASTSYPEQISKLTKYLGETKMENPSLTDYERHAMALMSLGINPYDTNNENYIEKIITSFDGTQFEDVNEDNDDIFALIVLQNTGYGISDKIINDDISFILNKQKNDGSWDGNVDMTGAAMEALAIFSPVSSVEESLKKAENFLKQNQKDNGGWSNASSTAWAIEGILALNEKINDWVKNGNTPLDYLATIQDTDGGMKNDNLQNKIWETAYVISALSGKTWNEIMQKFEKPKELKGQSFKNSPRTVLKNPKQKLTNQITATTINATTPPTPTQIKQKEIPRKNWFLKLLDNIFSIF